MAKDTRHEAAVHWTGDASGLKKANKEAVKGMEEVGKQMRWIGRDFLRISMFIGQIGKTFKGIWNRMATTSLSLEAAIQDINWVFDQMAMEIGEAVSPIVDGFASTLYGLLGHIENLGEPTKAFIGIMAWLIPVVLSAVAGIMSLIGMFMILEFGAVAVTSELLAAGFSTGYLTTMLGPLQWVLLKVASVFGLTSYKALTARAAFMEMGASSQAAAGLVEMSSHRVQRASIGFGTMAKRMGMMMIPMIGITAAFQGGITAGGVFASAMGAAGLGLMAWGPTPLSKIAGGILMIAGTIAQLFAGAGEGSDANERVMEKLKTDWGAAPKEAYDMAKQIKGTFETITGDIDDGAKGWEVFQDAMAETGYSLDEARYFWIEMGGSIVASTQWMAEESAISFLGLGDAALDSFVFIREAFRDGFLDPAEWERFLGSQGWYDIMQEYPDDAEELMLEIRRRLEEGNITLTDWDVNILGFSEAFSSMNVRAHNYWQKTRKQFTENEITDIMWGMALNIPDDPFGPIRDGWLSVLALMETFSLRDAYKAGVITFEEAIAAGYQPSWKQLGPSGSGIISAQSGGLVGETGLFYLHEGETVVPSGETGGTTVNTSVNIENASIRSEEDIYTLARVISEEQATRARRRGVLS